MEKDCDICGVDIADGAFPVNQHPSKKSTAFLLGNENTSGETRLHLHQTAIVSVMEAGGLNCLVGFWCMKNSSEEMVSVCKNYGVRNLEAAFAILIATLGLSFTLMFGVTKPSGKELLIGCCCCCLV